MNVTKHFPVPLGYFLRNNKRSFELSASQVVPKTSSRYPFSGILKKKFNIYIVSKTLYSSDMAPFDFFLFTCLIITFGIQFEFINVIKENSLRVLMQIS